MQRLLWLVLLAGCPAQNRYVVADVTSNQQPVQGALVAVDCGESAHHEYRGALRTDEDGRARVRVYQGGNHCGVLVAKPGYETVTSGPVNICPTTGACAPTRIDLASAFIGRLEPRIERRVDRPVVIEPQPYATEPRRAMEVAQ